MIEKICEYNLTINGKPRAIRLLVGDICSTEESYDLLLCSAFRNHYAPTWHTLLGSLQYECNISVDALSQTPEIDLRSVGCWVSQNTNMRIFSRIACLELRESSSSSFSREQLEDSLGSLRFLLEKMAFRGIPVASIAMPVLGTGNQGLPEKEVIPSLISLCVKTFQTIDEVCNISIFSMRPEFLVETTAQINRIIIEGFRRR